MEQKTHYRKVFKSDHLGSADLEEIMEKGMPLIFTISRVNSHFLDPNIKGSGITVAGRRVSANIAYFKEDIKPLVLNATNSKTVKSFIKGGSPFVEDWKDITIELYVDKSVKMKGEIVGGVRIMPTQPSVKPKPAFTSSNFEAAKKADATLDFIKKSYTITRDVELEYMDYAAA